MIWLFPHKKKSVIVPSTFEVQMFQQDKILLR